MINIIVIIIIIIIVIIIVINNPFPLSKYKIKNKQN